MKTDLYNQNAEKIGTTELSDAVFSAPWNPALVWQVAESERANQRSGLAHTKDRSEVRGGGKKPWRQKGTGRARHGSTRSPIWVGGGITHGPRNSKDYSRRINKKMARRALAVLLSQKLREGEVLILDNLAVSSGKTRDGFKIVKNIGAIKGYAGVGLESNTLAVIASGDMPTIRALRNIAKLTAKKASDIAVLDLLGARYLILTANGIGILESRLLKLNKS